MTAGRELETARKAVATASRDWEPHFLAALAKYGVITYACEAVGIGRSTAYRHREASQEFAAKWDEACEIAADMLEREAIRRAVDGVIEPVVSAGRHVTDVRKYSDRLLEFLLRGARPEKYRDKTEVHHSGSLGLTITALARKAEEHRRELEGGSGES